MDGEIFGSGRSAYQALTEEEFEAVSLILFPFRLGKINRQRS